MSSVTVFISKLQEKRFLDWVGDFNVQFYQEKKSGIEETSVMISRIVKSKNLPRRSQHVIVLPATAKQSEFQMTFE